MNIFIHIFSKFWDIYSLSKFQAMEIKRLKAIFIMIDDAKLSSTKFSPISLPQVAMMIKIFHLCQYKKQYPNYCFNLHFSITSEAGALLMYFIVH